MLRTVMMVIAWATLLLIAIATVSPIDVRPHLGSVTVERFGAFALTGLLFGLAYPRRLRAVAAVVLGAALLLEILQLLTPDRHGQVADAMVKFFGGAVGIGMSLMVSRLFLMLRRPPHGGKSVSRSNASTL